MSKQDKPFLFTDEKLKFLKNHFRYFTMNSWNKVQSFAAKVKLNNIYDKIPSEAFDFLDCEEAYEGIRQIIEDFTDEMNGEYTIIFSGRSNGYLVLVESKRKESEYKSFCPDCYQQSFAAVLSVPKNDREKLKNYVAYHNYWHSHVFANQVEARNLFLDMDDKNFIAMVDEIKKELKIEFGDARSFSNGVCGRCGSKNCNNFESSPKILEIHSGVGLGEDIDRYGINKVGEIYSVVKKFDDTVENCINSFKDYVESHTMEEREVMMPKKIKVPVERKAKV